MPYGAEIARNINRTVFRENFMFIYPGLLVRLCGAEIARRQVITVAEIGISRSGDGFFVDCCSKSSIFTVFV